MQHTILITGARAPIALELARSFNQKGHKVIMADSIHLAISRWSNTVHKYYCIPSPRFKNDAFVQKIQEIILKEKVDHFIPTCEEVVFVAAHRKKFDCKVWTVDQNLILNLHNKFQFSTLNQGVLPIPNTTLVKDFKDWDNSEKYVFKPIYSRFASSVIIKKKISQTYFSDEQRTKWIAQEFIAGREICTYSIWEEGVMKAYSAYHPLYRAGRGAGIFFEPVSNVQALKLVQEFGSQIKYTGQISFDVILDEKSTPYFIECNPRGTSGAHLINEHLANSFLNYSCYLSEQHREFSIKYIMALLHPSAFLKKRVRKSKDIIFHWNDLKPFFFQILSLMEIIYIKITLQISFLEATTHDIEWNDDGN
jgi:predicted ATP-grasp superfamily ATP-dependent carboligase